jgi:hypothetical protein
MVNYNWVTLGDMFRPTAETCRIKLLVLIHVVYDGTNYNTPCKNYVTQGTSGQNCCVSTELTYAHKQCLARKNRFAVTWHRKTSTETLLL